MLSTSRRSRRTQSSSRIPSHRFQARAARPDIKATISDYAQHGIRIDTVSALYKPQVLKLFLVARLNIIEMVATEKNHTANKKADKGITTIYWGVKWSQIQILSARPGEVGFDLLLSVIVIAIMVQLFDVWDHHSRHLAVRDALVRWSKRAAERLVRAASR